MSDQEVNRIVAAIRQRARDGVFDAGDLLRIAATLQDFALQLLGRSVAYSEPDPNSPVPVTTIAVAGPLAFTAQQAAVGLVGLADRNEAESANDPAVKRLIDLTEPELRAWLKLLELCIGANLPPGDGDNDRALFALVVFDQPGVAHFCSNAIQDHIPQMAVAFERCAANIRAGNYIHD